MHLDEWLDGCRWIPVIHRAAEAHPVANLDPRVVPKNLLVEDATDPIAPETLLPVSAASHREALPEAAFVATPEDMLRIQGQRAGMIAERAEVGPRVAAVLRSVKLR